MRLAGELALVTGSTSGARPNVGDPAAEEKLRFTRPLRGQWGNAGVNIADMDVGRVAGEDTAVMLIATTTEVAPDLIDALRSAPGVISVEELVG